MHRRSKLLIAFSALVVAGGLLAGVLRSLRTDAANPAAPAFQIAPITRGTIVKQVVANGRLAPSVSVEVSSQVSGLVTEVNVDFNSAVEKGDVLARIDPATFEQKLRQAEADLVAAESVHTLAGLNVERQKTLRDRDLVPQQDYDNAQAQWQQSEASLLTRRASVENARVDLERCTIRSPIAGVVIFKQVDVGRTVAASLSAPTLFVIARDLRRMQIIAPIVESDMRFVKPGQDVTFTVDAVPDQLFHGRVRQIRSPYTPSDRQQAPAAQPGQTPIATFDVVMDVENADLLLQPSLTAAVSIIVARRDDVLQIPSAALRVRLPQPPTVASPATGSAPKTQPAVAKTASAPGAGVVKAADESATTQRPARRPPVTVYRLPGGDRNATPEPVQVVVGVTDAMSAEVTSGLNEGDTVITGIAAAPQAMPRRGFFGM